MAGAGKKTFTAGEVLTASDVNTYLMEQSVMVFGGTAARSSAIPTPSEGMTTYIGVTGTATIPQIETYTGSEWQTPYGLTLLNTSTFNSVANFSLDNIFTTAYDNYRVVLQLTAGSLNFLSARMRASGVDDSTSNYASAQQYFTFAASTIGNDFQGATGTSWTRFSFSGSNSAHSFDIYNPKVSAFTLYTGLIVKGDTGITTMGEFKANTLFDGFSLISITGTISGKIRVYGYRNS
jgi:hypothetical protein